MYSRMIRRIIISILSAVFLIACSPALFIPTTENSAKAGVSLEQLQLGRKLYVSHCGSCHSLHLPKQYNSENWVRNLNKMQEKAKISDAEKAIILKFLTSQ